MRRLARIAFLVALPLSAPAPAGAQEVSGALRGGIYSDTDRTQIYRTLANLMAGWSKVHLTVQEAVDIVSSASVDVRSAPVDAVSSASSRGPMMSDRRFETTAGASYDDGRGHTGGLTLVHATERDYTSVGAGLSGSWDLFERTTTLLGGVSANHNWVASIKDPSFAATLDTLSYSLGVAQVLGQGDALRLRYDGGYFDGYQASPYRRVRFGDWSVSQGSRRDPMMVFSGTIGSADGLPERVPQIRVRHAAVGEWVHALGEHLGLLSQVRLAQDSWGIRSLTAGADLRFTGDGWQGRLGYHYYIQSGADFFLDKYTADPSMYAYYTSAKELGPEQGHRGSFDIGRTLKDWPARGRDSRLDLQLDLMHYAYPGFVLLDSRDSVFVSLGLEIGL